jgi:hypothetical protein
MMTLYDSIQRDRIDIRYDSDGRCAFYDPVS